MPRKDQTGPMGRGPLTGRRMGNCAGAMPTPCCGGYWGRRIILSKEEKLEILNEEEELALNNLEEIKKQKKILSEEG